MIRIFAAVFAVVALGFIAHDAFSVPSITPETATTEQERYILAYYDSILSISDGSWRGIHGTCYDFVATFEGKEQDGQFCISKTETREESPGHWVLGGVTTSITNPQR